MQDNAIVQTINKRLKIYGFNIYDDPIFRVVFSDDEREVRRTKIKGEVAEIWKYPWIKSKWILERWASGELSYHPSLITFKDGVYICVYVFQDKDQNYLPPLWDVTEIVVRNLLHPRTKSEALSQDKEIEEKNEEKEIDIIQKDLQIQSDEISRKDKRSIRESISIGYTESKIGEENV